MHILHRWVVILISLLFSLEAFGEMKGEGTSSKPYIIEELSDFSDLRTKIKTGNYIYVKQVKDIDISKASSGAGQPVFPLTGINWINTVITFNVDPKQYFYGEYDGGGYSLKGWKMPKNKQPQSITEYCPVSLFGKIGKSGSDETTVIKNLTVENAEIQMTATNKFGVSGYAFIASNSENARIENCHVKNSVATGSASFSFGYISANAKDVTISNCSVVDCRLENALSQKVGAICGTLVGNISKCRVHNTSVNGKSIIGGLVGRIEKGGIDNCSFNGTIGNYGPNLELSNIGGLCGQITNGSIINCCSVFTNGDNKWKSSQQFGGLIGDVDKDAKEIVVKNCYSFPQIECSSYLNAEIVVGKDESRETRVYESCYCYENSFGAGAKLEFSSGNGPFSESYKKQHSIDISSSDFMRSGCLAEILRDYNDSKLTGENPWREDIELQNDTLPVLKFMVDPAYDVKPFCHPLIFTVSHTESGNVSNLSGRTKYLTVDQNGSTWVHGIEVKSGNGDWTKLPSVINVPEGTKVVNFNENYTFSKSKTTVFRTFTYLKEDKTQIAYGKIDTICIGSGPAEPTNIFGCGTVELDGKVFDTSCSYTSSTGEEYNIKVGKWERKELGYLKGKCGENFYEYTEEDYTQKFYEPGYQLIYEFENSKLEKCVSRYGTVKLYPTIKKDSLKIFDLGEMSYTYESLSVDPTTIYAKDEFVLDPVDLIVDHVRYLDYSGCDSMTLNVKYIIPVKYTTSGDKEWICGPREHKHPNGVAVVYDKDTVVVDTIITDIATTPGKTYEIQKYHVKAKVAITVDTTRYECGSIRIPNCEETPDNPDIVCTTTEPFDYKETIKSRVCDCDSIIKITHYKVSDKQERHENIVSCGPYHYVYKTDEDTFYTSGVYKREHKESNDCLYDTIVYYHVTIGEQPSFEDVVVHGCEQVVYTNLKGDNVLIKDDEKKGFSIKTFVDELTTKEGCTASRKVTAYLHKVNKITPPTVQSCGKYVYTRLNGKKEVYDKSTVIYDTLKVNDKCDCDSVIKITKVEIQEATINDENYVRQCGPFVLGNKVFANDTSFVDTIVSAGSVCPVLQPYRIEILSSHNDTIHVDTCKRYEVNGKVLKKTGTLVFVKEDDECKSKLVYDVNMIEPVIVKDTVYSCDYYMHEYYDGRLRPVYQDSVLFDTIKSKVCLCDSIIHRVEVNIGHGRVSKMKDEFSCGPFAYKKKADGAVMMIKETQLVLDTVVDKYGCDIIYETKVTITPVETTILKDTFCNEYKSTEIVNRFNGVKKDDYVHIVMDRAEVYDMTLDFFKPNVLNKNCNDTLRLFASVRGVGKITAQPEMACDSFVYFDYDGSRRVYTESASILDTLKSMVCGCDSIIRTTNVIVNKSVPVEDRKTETLKACDSVIYVNAKNEQLKFTEDILFLDTFKTYTGCDSVVNVDVHVPKSTGTMKMLFACGDTTLIDTLNDYAHIFRESGSWHQVLSKNEVGCDNYIEWVVDITPTPRDTILEKGCGELSFRGHTYTSLEEKATSFSVEVSGATKCDTIHTYLLNVYPTYFRSDTLEGCDSVVRYDKVYTKSVIFRDTLMSRFNCDSIVDVNIIVNEAHDVHDKMFKCNEVKFVDKDYNGGDTVYVHNDSTIYVNKLTDKGCPYLYVYKIEVGHPTYLTEHTVECFDAEIGYVTFRDLMLTNDTIVYDTISSDNVCGTVIANVVSLIKSDDAIVSDTMFGCNDVTFIDPDYNGGVPVSVRKDSTIHIEKTTDKGCTYELVKEIKVDYTSHEDNKLFECVNTSGYVSFRDLHLTSDTIVYDTIIRENRCGTIVSNIINVLKPNDYEAHDTIWGCDSLKYIDVDYNGGIPLVFTSDYTINVNKSTADGCSYSLVQEIKIDHPTYSSEDVFVCYETKDEYASFRDLKLKNDTVIYDTIMSSRCGNIIEYSVNVIMPVRDTIYIDSCMQLTYEGFVYTDSVEIVRSSKSLESGCDSFTHVMLNVNKCFPYPVLVNKYNWILVCNDMIMNDDTFKLKSNVKYNWYKDGQLMSTTSESYFTEDKELLGCYQVGVIVADGSEFVSETVCFEEAHGYSISVLPNPVEKLQPIIVKCIFPDDSVKIKTVEVFNTMAEKVCFVEYTDGLLSNEFEIQGMIYSGYYYIRLTTDTDKVLTAKYIVK